MELIPGVDEALSLLKQAGFQLVVVSNQSGVGRGLISPEALLKIHARLQQLLSPRHVSIDEFYLCYHHPQQDCACRKPKPKLILDAALELGITLAESYMVGDKRSDIEAGWAAGCKSSLLVRTGEGLGTEKNWADSGSGRLPGFIGNNLLEVCHWILRQPAL